MRRSLFAMLLEEAWSTLPTEIRAIHEPGAQSVFAGRARVTRGNNPLAKLVALVARFPPATDDVAVSVLIESDDKHERWSRSFGSSGFSSELSAGRGGKQGLLIERFGPTRFAMRLVTDGKQLDYVPVSWTFLGLPMPVSLMPHGRMYETVRDSRFRFFVEIRLPLIGLIVCYDGWLE